MQTEPQLNRQGENFHRKLYPKISVILVTFNVASYLQKCLNSIYQQSYPSIEIIVIDGASTDGTIEILKTNTNSINKWISERDNGIYDAMNKAISYVTGEFVYFLGADDELLDDFSNFAFEIQSDSTIYYGNVIKNGKKYMGKVSPYQIAKTNINHQSMIYPVGVFRKYRFDLDYKISADHVLNMQCYKDSELSYHYLDYTIAIFNHTGLSSTKKDIVFEKRKAQLILKYFGCKIWTRFLFKKFKAAIFGRQP